MHLTRPRLALISVANKENLSLLAAGLAEQGCDLLSTGNSAQTLLQQGHSVRDVAKHTGMAEMMDGRIKTLHPHIHGGILARRGQDDALLQAEGITAIDLVVVNLYPFEQAIRHADCNMEKAIEQIDIGGSAMLRAAAKNHQFVTVLSSPDDYALVLESWRREGGISLALRRQLAARAFAISATYEAAIAAYFGKQVEQTPYNDAPILPGWRKKSPLRYGENPHQKAHLYVAADTAHPAGLAGCKQLQGGELSYNNLSDGDAAWRCISEFQQPACAIIKHNSPCGVAIADKVSNAFQQALRCDTESAFGGIVACNREIDEDSATMIANGPFLELLIAPAFSAGACKVLAARRRLRLLCDIAMPSKDRPQYHIRSISGGLLCQQQDDGILATAPQIVSQRPPSVAEQADLLFAWQVAKHVTSNAVVYARQGMTIGIGNGQTSRVQSARLAATKAQQATLELSGSVMASDAFLPFRDGLDTAAKLGITALIQPGGSIRDDEVIAAANEHQIAMLFTGQRHFRH